MPEANDGTPIILTVPPQTTMPPAAAQVPARPSVRPIEVALVEDRSEVEDTLMLEHGTLDPNWHYRWVQERPQRIQRMRAKGYTFVDREADGVRPVIDQGGAADTTIRNGDTVLMKTPKARFLATRKKVGEATRARLAVPTAQFRKKAADAGVKDTNKDME